MPSDQQRTKRVERAQTKVIFTSPFFAPGVAKLPVVWDTGVETACTDGTCIRWNPEWFDKLPDPQLVTLLVHETCHCLLGHVWRAPEGAEHDTWNIACDHAVNLMLKDFSAQVMAKALADPFPFPEGSYYCDPQYKDMAEEVIYSRLASQQKQPQPGGRGSGSGSGASGGNNTAPQQSKSPQRSAGAKAGASGKPAGSQPQPFGQVTVAQNGTQQAGKSLQNDWQATLLQSAKIAQGQGTLPAGMERLVGELVHPTVPWWELLRSWLREQVSDDWDWLKPAMEYEGCGFILPSLNSERCGPIVFATDTSGSINEELLARFQTEKQQCLDTLRPRRLVDVYCDSTIHKVEEYAPGDIIAKQCPGGGGTDFRPVFERVARMPEPIKCLVYLTDLWGSFPDEAPPYPVIWCVWGSKTAAPFGEVVKCDTD